ncbi:MAG: hypothetical protein PUC49_05935 [Clostridiales bacterium]|nr:hypothetical protein [Clostridiales bacterium]
MRKLGAWWESWGLGGKVGGLVEKLEAWWDLPPGRPFRGKITARMAEKARFGREIMLGAW